MRQFVVDLIRRPVVKSGVVAALVVLKAKPLGESFAKLTPRVERMQVEVLVLDRPPQPFDEDLVLASTPSAHADGDFVVLENLSEGDPGKLGALVGVEDLRQRSSASRSASMQKSESRVFG